MESELEKALLGRREKLLKRFLSRLSPLARPRLLPDRRLCVADARVEGGLVVKGNVTARTGGQALAVERRGAESCTAPITSADAYVHVELRADDTNVLRVHLYRAGDTYRIAGLDRDE
jgi:hypothetical protein